MLFLAHEPNRRDDGGSLPAHRRLAKVLLGCCAFAGFATAFPWIAVESPRLFGWFQGPVAARTTPGFTCVTTCLLTALLLLGEGRDDMTRESVRTACAMLMGAAAVVLVVHFANGPGLLRGVDAEFSTWFFAAVLGAIAGAITARHRLRRHRDA